mgnify:CR=1 FL=1
MRFFGRTRTPWEGDFPLTRRRIYVLPSRMGLIFAGALLVMLVLTINYGLNYFSFFPKHLVLLKLNNRCQLINLILQGFDLLLKLSILFY